LLSLRREDRNLAGIAEQNCPQPGKRNPAGCAIKEAHPEIVFESFDLKSYCRLRKEKMFRGLVKVKVLGDGTKYLKPKILQLCHGKIIHGNCRPYESVSRASVSNADGCGGSSEKRPYGGQRLNCRQSGQ